MARITITVPDTNPQPYSFGSDCALVTLGRDPDNDISIESGFISQKHAVMIRVQGGYELQDTGSTNGLQVDGDFKNRHFLRHNDTVMLGDVSFVFHLSAEEQEALSLELAAGKNPGPVPKNNTPRVPAAGPMPKKPGLAAPGKKKKSPGRFLLTLSILVLLACLSAYLYNNGTFDPVRSITVAVMPPDSPAGAAKNNTPTPQPTPQPTPRPGPDGTKVGIKGKTEPTAIPPRNDPGKVAETTTTQETTPDKVVPPRNIVDRNAALNPADPNDKEFLKLLEWKNFNFDDEVRTAYLQWAKTRALRSVLASAYDNNYADSPGNYYKPPTLEELIPSDFLEWVDSKPDVAATIYGISENADQRLVMLRSLDIDLGKKNVRHDYTQLALALTDKYAVQSDPVTLTSSDNIVHLNIGPPYKLEIPKSPIKPVNTRATDRTLDMEDHIINFLEEHAVPIGGKNRLYGELDVRIAKGMGWWTTDRINKQEKQASAPGERKSLLDDEERTVGSGSVKTEKRENPKTRPLYAYEVMTSPALQHEFNEYMKSKGFDVSINTGTSITGTTPLLTEVLKASAMFMKAYFDKGRLPKENDRQAAPLEMAAFLIRNDKFRFPNPGKSGWPRFDLNSPWPVLDFLVSDRMPIRERQYIWELLRDHGIAEGYGEYLGDGIAQNPPLLQARKLQPYDFAYNTYPMMVKDGGVCGVMAQIGIRLNIALGVPAIHASQPGHACLVSISGNERSGFFLNIEQSATGGPEDTGVSGRGSYIEVRNKFYPLNYGFKQYLEAKMIYRLFSILPPGVSPQNRLNLLGKGLDVNPFNLELASAYVQTMQEAKPLVDFCRDITKKIHRKIDGITNPDDYLKSVKALVEKRLDEVPVPRGLLDTKYVADWLGDNRSDPAWLKYGVAVHGTDNFTAMVCDQLKQYVEKRGGTLEESTLLAKRIQLVGNSITDTTLRAEFGKKLHAFLLGYNTTRLDPIAEPKRLEEKKQVIALGLNPDKYLIPEPFLPVIYSFGFDVAEAIRDFERTYEASMRGKRSKELAYVMHQQLLLLDTYIKDPVWRKTLGTALYHIIGGREIFAPESAIHSNLALDPTIKTIYSLGIDPTQAANDIAFTYSAALREPRTVDTAIALADYLSLIAGNIQEPGAKAKLALDVFHAFRGNRKFLVGPGIKPDKSTKQGGDAQEEESVAQNNGKKKKPLLDPALPILFELGVDINQVKKDIVPEFDEYVREPRTAKSSKAFAEYLTLVFKYLQSADEQKSLGTALSHIISDREIFEDPTSHNTELDATVPILYSVCFEVERVQGQIEAALGKSVNGRRSIGSTKGLAKQIEAAGAAFPDQERRKAWGEKLLAIMKGKEQFQARKSDKEKPAIIDDPCQQSIYSHLIMN